VQHIGADVEQVQRVGWRGAASQQGRRPQELFAFVQDVGEVYGRAYTTLMRQNRDLPYDAREKHWQLVRRSRYAEFNLAPDRGTRFGLETGGRTESMLMSLPPQAAGPYNEVPVPGSAEAATLAWLRPGIGWV
jgi:coproporphyrinogen III oxidase